MGKNAGIYRINNLKGEPKGIMVYITISESTFPYECCIEHLKDKKDVVYLGEPSDIIYPFTWRRFPTTDEIEKKIEMDEIREIQRELGEISDEILNWEKETLDDMQIEAEMEEAEWTFVYNKEHPSYVRFCEHFGSALFFSKLYGSGKQNQHSNHTTG